MKTFTLFIKDGFAEFSLITSVQSLSKQFRQKKTGGSLVQNKFTLMSHKYNRLKKQNKTNKY